jgi:hypothetical protein
VETTVVFPVQDIDDGSDLPVVKSLPSTTPFRAQMPITPKTGALFYADSHLSSSNILV